MILIAAIENHKNPEIDALCNDYVKRCSPMHSVKIELLPAARTPDPEAQKAKESETVLKLMKPGDTLILCDERGKAFTSRGIVRVFFLCRLRQQYPAIKLSEFVFPHHLARLVLTEQIYRVLNILKGTGYHHD